MSLFLEELTAYEAYYIMSCIATLIYVWQFPKKQNFKIKLIVSVAVGACLQILIAVFSALTMDTISTTAGAIIKYTLSGLYVYVILIVSFKIKLTVKVFFVLYGSAFQNLSSILFSLIKLYIPAFGEFNFVVVYCVRFLLFIVVLAFNVLLFGKQLRSIKEMEIDVANVIILFIFYSILNTILSYLVNVNEDIYILTTLYIVEFIFDIGVFLLDYWMLKVSQERVNKKVREAIYQREQEQFESLKKNMEDVNARYHDLKYYISLFERNAAAGDLGELKNAIADYGSQYNTGNNVLDLVLSEKSRACTERQINFSFMAQTDKLPDIADVDIYSLFGNAIDNAIEYLSTVEEVEKRILYIRIYKKNVNFLICDIGNWCEKAPEITAEGNIATSKRDKNPHGIGIPNIRRVAEKYGGNINIKFENNFFHLYITFLLK